MKDPEPLDRREVGRHHSGVDETGARLAQPQHDWPALYEKLRSAGDLDASDLSALADAAWWLGKLDESAAAREAAFEAKNSAGDLAGAALEAFLLSLALGDKGEEALASGWRSRAARLAEQEPASLAGGYLLSMEALSAFHSGAAAESVAMARETAEIGRLQDDDTLVAWATHIEGLALVKLGDVDQGWARLDESMVSAITGRLKPMWAGLMHCGMLVACEEYGDPRRGWQWVEATERWLGTVPGAVLYPGVCRVHKVRIMQMRGTWPEAEAEARAACADLLEVHAYTAGLAYYEIAEIKRMTGAFDDAFELYKKSNALGFDPQPGLARLRVAQGRIDAASAGLRRALNETVDPLLRAVLLPHQVETSLAGDDLEHAAAAADELRELAARYRSPIMRAWSGSADGALHLAKGDPSSALPALRDAVSEWMRLDCSYELARTRVTMAAALDAAGDADSATFEREAALVVFESLGAEPDARRLRGVLGGTTRPLGLSGREVDVLRLVATGCSNKEIASRLFISENTVARHVQNIFAKLGVTSRSAAASVAVKEGLT